MTYVTYFMMTDDVDGLCTFNGIIKFETVQLRMTAVILQSLDTHCFILQPLY